MRKNKRIPKNLIAAKLTCITMFFLSFEFNGRVVDTYLRNTFLGFLFDTFKVKKEGNFYVAF